MWVAHTAVCKAAADAAAAVGDDVLLLMRMRLRRSVMGVDEVRVFVVPTTFPRQCVSLFQDLFS